jgi:hypothetical protein
MLETEGIIPKYSTLLSRQRNCNAGLEFVPFTRALSGGALVLSFWRRPGRFQCIKSLGGDLFIITKRA